MPTPVKPCGGRFSDELQSVLTKNSERAQWATHPCEVCGLSVGAVMVQGKWVPEQHWPTVKYPARTRVESRRYSRDGSVTPHEDSALASPTSR